MKIKIAKERLYTSALGQPRNVLLILRSASPTSNKHWDFDFPSKDNHIEFHDIEEAKAIAKELGGYVLLEPDEDEQPIK